MTALKEELKVRPDEGPIEYAERAEAALEQHRRETGERLSVWGTMPGEGTGAVLERTKAPEAAAIRAAGEARRTQHEANRDLTLLAFPAHASARTLPAVRQVPLWERIARYDDEKPVLTVQSLRWRCGSQAPRDLIPLMLGPARGQVRGSGDPRCPSPMIVGSS